MTYTWFFHTGGIACEGVEIEAHSLREASKLLVKELKTNHPDLIHTVQDLNGVAKCSHMNFDDYISAYGYKYIDSSKELYARVRGLVYDNKLFIL